MKKRMFMALAVALTGVSMVVAAGNGELKIQSETSVQKVHAAGIHQIVSSRSRLPDRLP